MTSTGALGRNRTCDTRFRKPVLYPLSYEGAVCESSDGEIGTAGLKEQGIREAPSGQAPGSVTRSSKSSARCSARSSGLMSQISYTFAASAEGEKGFVR
jgi:hypothetical protein